MYSVWKANWAQHTPRKEKEVAAKQTCIASFKNIKTSYAFSAGWSSLILLSDRNIPQMVMQTDKLVGNSTGGNSAVKVSQTKSIV